MQIVHASQSVGIGFEDTRKEGLHPFVRRQDIDAFVLIFNALCYLADLEYMAFRHILLYAHRQRDTLLECMVFHSRTGRQENELSFFKHKVTLQVGRDTNPTSDNKKNLLLVKVDRADFALPELSQFGNRTLAVIAKAILVYLNIL